ncbi:hypothetical protein Lal_00031539 [Lupinus albus]|nr:hypothetical protein Lal_00031539 [Lupinus albus]
MMLEMMLMIAMLRIPSLRRQKVVQKDQDQKGELKLKKSHVVVTFLIVVERIMTQEIVQTKGKKNSLLSSQSPNNCGNSPEEWDILPDSRLSERVSPKRETQCFKFESGRLSERILPMREGPCCEI